MHLTNRPINTVSNVTLSRVTRPKIHFVKYGYLYFPLTIYLHMLLLYADDILAIIVYILLRCKCPLCPFAFIIKLNK